MREITREDISLMFSYADQINDNTSYKGFQIRFLNYDKAEQLLDELQALEVVNYDIDYVYDIDIIDMPHSECGIYVWADGDITDGLIIEEDRFMFQGVDEFIKFLDKGEINID